MGHVRDLPKSKLGVDIESDFAPEYVVIPARAKVIKELKDAAKSVTDIFVATDPDREGEAIGWHLAEELGRSKKKVHRLMFNEITKKAILEAIKHPGEIDMRMVDAQQARRVLDRLVGYKISPILWDKVRRGSERRTRAVGRAEADLRPRAGDRGVRSGGVLAPHGAAGRAGAARDSRPGSSSAATRPSRSGARPRPTRILADLANVPVRRLVGDDEGAEEARDPAVHHEQAAAGVAVPGQEDDDAGAAALRGHRSAGRGRGGRPHHLHADGLGSPVRPGAGRSAAAHRRPVRRRLSARAAEPVPREGERAGCARSDSADVHEVHAGRGAAASHARPALPLPHHLGAVRRVADDACGVRRHDDRHHGGRLSLPGEGIDAKFAGWLAAYGVQAAEAEESERAERPSPGAGVAADAEDDGAGRLLPPVGEGQALDGPGDPPRTEVHAAAGRATARRRSSRRSKRTASAVRAPTRRSSPCSRRAST